MVSDLNGRTALITGSSRGIGAAIALALAERGADIAISYNKDIQSANIVRDKIRRLGRKAECFVADVGIESDAERLAAEVQRTLGPVSILVNNAGFGTSAVGRPSVVEMTLDNTDLLIRTHIYGPLVLCRSLVPHMRALERGDVIMISSIAAQALRANSGTYNIAKAGMEALAMTLAKEERQYGIRVNVVAPGLVDTDMGRGLVNLTRGVTDMRALDGGSPFGFVCQPQDIANTVAFLVSDGGRYITGQRIIVDGGSF
jgi:NAD(P)-dependent dehydrogenase (short-subunit alcohol dehydrogenase family)